MKFFPRESVKFAVLLAVAIGAGPASAAFWQWSKTSSSNASADPSINWAEGMSPSSVNDSARAMMARAAEYRDDISGLLTTGGTPTAYTVTTNQGLNATPNDGQLLAVTVNATNGASATLTADGGTAFAIQSAAGVAVAAGTLVSGSPYSLKFSVSNNAWMLRSFYGTPYSIPLGGIMATATNIVPNSNFAFPNGQCISRTTYAALFALTSTAYGVCDGTTTFGLPDLRGRIMAALDTLGGAANANRLSTVCTSTQPGAACGAQNQIVAQANLPNVALPVSDPGHLHLTDNTQHAFVGTTTATIFPPGGGGAVAIPSVLTDMLGTSQFETSFQTTGITVSTGGSGTALTTTQPTMMMGFVMRIF